MPEAGSAKRPPLASSIHEPSWIGRSDLTCEPRKPPGPPRSYQCSTRGEGQSPGRQGAVWVRVSSSEADVVVQDGSNAHGGVQVTSRQVTGP